MLCDKLSSSLSLPPVCNSSLKKKKKKKKGQLKISHNLQEVENISARFDTTQPMSKVHCAISALH